MRDVLITADKRGIDSHGIGRLKTIYYDRIKAGIQEPVTKMEIIKKGRLLLYRRSQWNEPRYFLSSEPMAIEKATAYGMGMVAVRNSTHYGIAGYYALMAVEKAYWDNRKQCSSFYCPYFWSGKHAGYKSPYFRYSH